MFKHAWELGYLLIGIFVERHSLPQHAVEVYVYDAPNITGSAVEASIQAAVY